MGLLGKATKNSYIYSMKDKKKCNKCNKIKNISEFGKCKEWFQSSCKTCKSEYDKKRRFEKAEEICIKNKDRYSKLTEEQKRQRNLNKKRITVNCKICNNELIKRQDALKKWSGMCLNCSRLEVLSRPETKERQRKNGLDFIKKFGKIPSPKMENRPRGKNHHNFGIRRTGENSFNWKGGVTPENERIRHSKEYKEWRISVFERDKYSCVNCGDNRGGNLNADHIKPFSLFPELRLDVNNGRTLCIECHKEIGWSPSKNKFNGTAWVSH